MCPVDALVIYMDGTEASVLVHGTVFVALNISSSVSNILNHAVQLASLGDTGYSTRNFRPIVAT